MLTREQIGGANKERDDGRAHEHERDECIKIAFEWLDAQTKLKAPNRRRTWPIKHLIAGWSGRHVTQSDVELAAHLHPQIIGEYPYYNIGSRLIRPDERRLSVAGLAPNRPNGDHHTAYARAER